MAIVDGLIVCVQLHGGAGRGRGRAGREADSLTPGSEFSHPLKERPDCVRGLSDKHLIPAQTHSCVCVCVCGTDLRTENSGIRRRALSWEGRKKYTLLAFLIS